MTATTTRRLRITYDTTTCSRCGGSGRMPYSVYGGVCFKCNGKGQYLTPQGRKVRAWFDAWAERHLTVAASTLEPGDRIVVHGATWTVTERTTTLGKGNGRSMRGVEGTDTYVETWTYGQTTINYERRTRTGVVREGYLTAAHASVRLAWTTETLQAALDECRFRKGYTTTEEK